MPAYAPLEPGYCFAIRRASFYFRAPHLLHVHSFRTNILKIRTVCTQKKSAGVLAPPITRRKQGRIGSKPIAPHHLSKLEPKPADFSLIAIDPSLNIIDDHSRTNAERICREGQSHASKFFILNAGKFNIALTNESGVFGPETIDFNQPGIWWRKRTPRMNDDNRRRRRNRSDMTNRRRRRNRSGMTRAGSWRCMTRAGSWCCTTWAPSMITCTTRPLTIAMPRSWLRHRGNCYY